MAPTSNPLLVGALELLLGMLMKQESWEDKWVFMWRK